VPFLSTSGDVRPLHQQPSRTVSVDRGQVSSMEKAPRCPNCGKLMRVMRTLPAKSGGEEEINVFKCGSCNVNFITEDHHRLFGNEERH
jgi:hypothetical protein